ncbi:helix-turn-helix domain-containing protein [Salegentibacter sediminis]|uniref:helix-turn-helix domain-containing protein n=1 Tax=Salegentibacter sediminis TaxID=1930251 RepID=UPI0009C04F25|nr:helix-turn-helix transcriptional regulator [Salegentibacter sediminis]
MVNTEKFAARLEKIIDYYDLSAAAFADQIEVGRSSISHILSGRNKPSLDFVMKVISHFPEVELYWLLNGKGKFPKERAVSTPQPEFQSKPIPPIPEKENPSSGIPQHKIPMDSTQKEKQIKKIVIFYTDGTFEAFEN